MTKLPSNHIVICMSIIYSVYLFSIPNFKSTRFDARKKREGKGERCLSEKSCIGIEKEYGLISIKFEHGLYKVCSNAQLPG